MTEGRENDLHPGSKSFPGRVRDARSKYAAFANLRSAYRVQARYTDANKYENTSRLDFQFI